MNSKRKCKRGICRTLIVVMMVSMMGGVYPMMRENQARAYTRTMNVNDWLEQCRLIAIKISDEKARLTGIFLERDIKVRRVCIVQITLLGVFSDTR